MPHTLDSPQVRINTGSDAVYALPVTSGNKDFERSSLLESSLAKRLFDVFFATIALVCTAPVLLVTMILIPIQSPGWPVFIQSRVGKNGRVFKILKLRTMQIGADKLAFKTARDDNRLHPLGRFLRHTNIDELPQLLNILAGHMSVIGPRPLSVAESQYIADHKDFGPLYPGFLPTVRPGLVGLDLFNKVTELDYKHRFACNYRYEQERTLTLDTKIFLRAMHVCQYVCAMAAIGATVILVLSIMLLHG